MANQSNYSLRYMDYSKEESGVTFAGVKLTAANFAAQRALMNDLKGAITDIVIGTMQQEKVIGETNNSGFDAPTDKNAQRERKWLVAYKDITQYFDFPSTSYPNSGHGKEFTIEIPTADLSLLPDTHSDTLDPDDPSLDAKITDFITAFEAYQRSPYNGQVEVTEITAVGRNL